MRIAYDINTQTPLIPYIIAERAIWNVLETDNPQLTSNECCAIVESISPKLVEKAEILYKKSKHFRQSINNKRNDSRYTLEMFMEHWSKALIKQQSQPITM